jgi:hypothetical protein
MAENETVETSGCDSNSSSQKSRAITNLETRFEEFESLPHRQSSLMIKCAKAVSRPGRPSADMS